MLTNTGVEDDFVPFSQGAMIDFAPIDAEADFRDADYRFDSFWSPGGQGRGESVVNTFHDLGSIPSMVFRHASAPSWFANWSHRYARVVAYSNIFLLRCSRCRF